jgi:hypothetical protein
MATGTRGARSKIWMHAACRLRRIRTVRKLVSALLMTLFPGLAVAIPSRAYQRHLDKDH